MGCCLCNPYWVWATDVELIQNRKLLLLLIGKVKRSVGFVSGLSPCHDCDVAPFREDIKQKTFWFWRFQTGFFLTEWNYFMKKTVNSFALAKVLIPSGLCRYHRCFSIVKKANWAVCSSKTIGLCTAGSTFFMPEAIVLAS